LPEIRACSPRAGRWPATILGGHRINWNLYADFHKVPPRNGQGDNHLNEL
jgi:hypothetical protein